MHVPDEANIGSAQAVAIIGAALRFPGASDPSSFHELTVTGRCMFRPLAHRPDPGVPSGGGDQDDQSAGQRLLLAAQLGDGGSGFGRDDELTGGITARHILAAETAAAALADVPPVGRAVAPERVGVFIADVPEPGTTDVREWVHRQLRMLSAGTPVPAVARRRDIVNDIQLLRPVGAGLHDFLLGTIGAVRAGHRGTTRNGTVNGTAVVNGSSSRGPHCSLRAVAEACEALNAGEFDLVLAGGVAKGIGNWTRGHAGTASSASHVRVYDLSPTGSLPGEGCGIVALSRAADARALGLPAYAEIAGWHYAGQGVTQPAVLHEAYLRAGIDPANIQFVEGHGAATAAEDLAELSALLDVLGPRTDGAVSRCALGSVSANIGDTRAAAGVAALLKTAFAMTADVIPPSTGCVRPNRLLRKGTTPFRLPSAPELWPQTPVQLAAVNTLGTAPSPDAPRSGPVHLVLRRDRDLTLRPGRRRKPSPLLAASLALDIPRQPQP
jgi:enediyne polyketide synthase